MASKKVKRIQRLLVPITLRFPDINEGKSYKSLERKFIVEVDGKQIGIFNQISTRFFPISAKLRSVVVIKKVYGDKRPDSIFKFVVGENFATLVNQNGLSKRVELDFTKSNIVDILTDIQFNKAIDIS